LLVHIGDPQTNQAASLESQTIPTIQYVPGPALRQNDRLAHLLRQLQRMQFGRRSEKLDPDQFALALEDIEQVVAAREAADDKQNKAAAAARVEKRRASRGALPAHLPRVHVTIEPEDWNCPCCRSPMHAIGADVSERLDVVPAQFRVLVTHRPKYARRACEEAVVQAPAPERLIKGGLPTEAMVASVLVSKYAWRLPLYRQPRCWPPRASTSSARRWLSGLVTRPPNSGRSLSAFANSS
jgi:transposase